MNKRQDGRDFEELVAQFYEALTEDDPRSSIEKNVHQGGPDGVRQIDVLVRSKIADIDVLLVIECKDYKSIVNIQVIDELESKLRDLNATRGILVTRKGFSGGAKKKAKRCGIALYTLDKLDPSIADPEINTPLYVYAINPKHVTVSHIIAETIIMHEEGPLLPSGLTTLELMRMFHPHELMGGDEMRISIKERAPHLDLYMDLGRGGRGQLSDCFVDLRFEKEFYYGFLGDLPSSMIKRDEIDGSVIVRYDDGDFSHFSRYLQRFEGWSNLPRYSQTGKGLVVIMVPTSLQHLGKRQTYFLNADSISAT